MSFQKVAIANRSEVAVRIIRACQELGLETVLLHSEADINTLAYRLADETVCIGEAPSYKSYLNIDKNIKGALSVGAEALHPGFGFLSENADFAKACEKNKIVFIGPSQKVLETFSNKTKAKQVARSINCPVLEDYDKEDQSLKTLLLEGDRIGYPLMVKAHLGGGGRGLRVVEKKDNLEQAIIQAKREAQSSFGDEQIFLEKYLQKAKHIEAQIFGDASGTLYALGLRDCSVQRHHQKIIEEAGELPLSPSLQEALLTQALHLGKEVSYKGAGTVEFLVEDEKFYFLEVNTRLQVEHPVTEMVWGVDLVKAQLLTAQNKAVFWKEKAQKARGHCIECRIYAEDPYEKNLPSTGEFLDILLPYAPYRRFDIGYEKGDSMTPYYDSLITKAIVWDETRERAIRKMKKTLEDLVIFGVKTNIPLLQKILSHETFLNSQNLNVRFLEKSFKEGMDKTLNPSYVLRQEVFESLQNFNGFEKEKESEAGEYSSFSNPWFEEKE